MSYTLTLGSHHLITDALERTEEKCDCELARSGCMPGFVFSVAGQVGFRLALKHLATCQKTGCRSLTAQVYRSMRGKMFWLMEEKCLLGCVQIQPLLYGQRRLLMARKDFPQVAHHLARCPKDSCAQLRRSVLLDIRDGLRQA